MLRVAELLYGQADGTQRRWLNMAVFTQLELDVIGDDEPRSSMSRQDSLDFVVRETLAPVVKAVCGVTRGGRRSEDDEETVSQVGPLREQDISATGVGDEKTPAELSFVEGSNLNNLAETEGFEPSNGLPRYHLSRVAH